MADALDDLDRRLVGALHLRPRGSFDELGSVLGVDASTVGRRYARLVEERLVRVVGQVDWSMYSTALPVHLLIDTAGTAPHVVIDRLRELAAVQYLAQTSGRSSVFATVHAASEPATAALLDEVYALAGVAAVRTLPVLEVHGRGAGWEPRVLSAEERERSRAFGVEDLDERGRPAPPHPLVDPERQVVELLRQDGRASAAAVGRATGLPPSTAHRVVRRILDHGWVRPRVEVEPALLGFLTPFVLQVAVTPDRAGAALRTLTALPETRFTTRVAGRTTLLCTGLVADRPALARFLDEHVAAVAGLLEVEVDIVLAERRRYWLDRGDGGALGRFAPPALR